MKTGIITTDTYLNHDTGQGHPERADRVTVVIDHLKKLKSNPDIDSTLLSGMDKITPMKVMIIYISVLSVSCRIAY